LLGELAAVLDLEVDKISALGNSSTDNISASLLTITEIELGEGRSMNEERVDKVIGEPKTLEGQRLEGPIGALELREECSQVLERHKRE
jgi:hypothetical protein